mmetsp:Transcript_68152/g.134553  ORF Transcript_68152/g.134553 Transcript_68152/m.134553 type:complete len:150 (+) Transcript_68152:86-535(+)
MSMCVKSNVFLGLSLVIVWAAFPAHGLLTSGSEEDGKRSCSSVWEQCTAKKLGICGSYGWPLHAGPTCQAAICGSFIQTANSTASSMAMATGSSLQSGVECKLELAGCRTCFTADTTDYPDPEQVCVQKCRECAVIEDYHSMKVNLGKC